MMRPESLTFLREFSESFGPSGFERDPARLLKGYVESYCDSVRSDRLGSLLFEKRGSAEGPVVLLPGHIDEVGFVVSAVGKEGFVAFSPVGGWFDQVLLAQRVRIRTAKGDLVPAVVASKPPHVLSPEERAKVVKQQKMFLDVGASNRDEVEAMGVRIGDPIVPESAFTTVTKKVFEEGEHKGLQATVAMGKAFDDRLGAFVAAETVRRLAEEKLDHPNRVIGAGTVQEEVGLRGAGTTAWLADPDVCLTLEVDIARDVPGMDADQAEVRMGKGPSILTFDATLVPNQDLKELVISTAEEEGIPHQLSHMRGGGTDAGIIHRSRAGCPSIVLAVPTRHIHSHVAMADLADVTHLVDLVIAVVRRLDEPTVTGFTQL